MLILLNGNPVVFAYGSKKCEYIGRSGVKLSIDLGGTIQLLDGVIDIKTNGLSIGASSS